MGRTPKLYQEKNKKLTEKLTDLSIVHEAINRIKSDRDRINNEVSKIDKEVNDHYHVLELLELNGAEMVKIASSLRKLLRKRRTLKEQQIMLTNFLSSNVESAKDLKVSETNAHDRLNKYRSEAMASYARILGKSTP